MTAKTFLVRNDALIWMSLELIHSCPSKPSCGKIQI